MKFPGSDFNGQVTSVVGPAGKKFYQISLIGSATVEHTKAALDFLRQALACSFPVIIETSSLSQVDISFFQLLFAAARSAHSSGHEVYLANIDENHPLARSSRAAGILPQNDGTLFGLRYPAPRRSDK